MSRQRNGGGDRARGLRILGLSLLLAWLLPGPGALGREPSYSWQKPHAKVLETGELEWAPRPFRFEAGPSVRYIDFDEGNDRHPGTRDRPWKHHPWDPDARGRAAAASGPHTYVFKRGVIYRGSLVGEESGSPEQPIRLTNDPAWGEGEAVIAGSEAVTGWTRGADRRDIPDPDKVWRAEVEFLPRCAWVVEAGGRATRLHLARTPNWEISDPEDIKSEWWEWQQPRFWENDYTTEGPSGKLHLGIDDQHITREKEYYLGAVVWTEWGIAMGTPYPTRVETVDTARRGLGFQGPYFGASERIVTGHRYFLEDRPHYLDEPGEFWFDRDGNRAGGTLYVRLPGEADPSTVRVEAARHVNLIDSRGMNHVRMSGLTFRFTNAIWDYTVRTFQHPDADGACLRIQGGAEDVEVANCRFAHVNKAVRIRCGERDRVDRIVVRDNEIRDLDRGAIEVENAGAWGKYRPPFGFVGDVKVLRNRIHRTGQRPYRRGFGHTLVLRFPRTAEVAGNILSRTGGSGIFVFGGKGDNELHARLLTRILIHHNRVEDSLLNTNDWGGIETWFGGPFYVFNNISGNPGGFWNWKYTYHKDSARLGFAFYLDGSNKNYLFNNIAWGRTNEPTSKYTNETAFYEAGPRIMNSYFNNTVYKFRMGSQWSARHGYHWCLGNVWSDLTSWVLKHASTKEDPPGAEKKEFPHHTTAYSRNVFHNISEKFGAFENNARPHSSPESFRDALVQRRALTTDLGVLAEEPVLREPADHDFRPRPGSAAIDRGVRAFVPWSLRATVGEWLFYPAGNDPTTILDEHWVVPQYVLTNRQVHRRVPLKVVNADADSYEEGPLEDWVAGALGLNGRDRYARASHEDMTAPYHVRHQVRGGGDPVVYDRTIEGSDLLTPDIHTGDLLVEVFFRAGPGQGEAVLVEKLAAAGYSLRLDAQGRAVFHAAGPDRSRRVTGEAILADGEWHHVIAELDRESERLTLYLDGRRHAQAPGLGPQVSLTNPADLYVGGTPRGRCLAGAIDFVRIAQATLADSETTIGELYAWEFDGPQYRDFTGRSPTGDGRDAGALELAE